MEDVLGILIGHVKKHSGHYVGRPSVLGNPASHKAGTASIRVDTVREAVMMYDALMRSWMSDASSPQRAEVLRLARVCYDNDEDLTLLCWCSHQLRAPLDPPACHADVIAREISRVMKEML